MLIIIILSVLTLVGVALLILAHFKYYWDEVFTLWGVTLSFLSGVPLLVCGIICMCINTPTQRVIQAIENNAKVYTLKDRQSTIYQALTGELSLTVQDTGREYHVIIDSPLDIANAIYEYNCQVIDFKKNLYVKKVQYDSPWINWFQNPGFKDVEGYNDSATDYRDILGDTLKTFELTKRENQ